MSARSIGTIYAKELADSLRDRRTLVSALLMPMLLMPVLILGIGTLASRVVSRARQEVPRIMVVGGADSPGIRAELEKSGKFRVEAASADWRRLISDRKVRAAVEIPAGFERALESGSAPPVTLYDFEGELNSGMAAGQLRTFFTGLRERTTARLLAARGLPESVARPFEVRQSNVAPPEKTGGNLVGGFLAYIIITFCIIGAMYPAMDLAAGEKERGTMETLLCSPVSRTDIVLGKFLMVLTGSLAAVACSLISLGVTLAAVGTALGAGPGGAARGGAGVPMTVDPLGLLGVLAMVIPVSVLFSAVLFTVSLFAKSYKEAQTYAQPVVFIGIIPLGIGMLPGIDLNMRLALVPVLNISLVCKEMLSGVWHWGYIAAIFATTAVYAAAALALAVRMFRSEGVIFRT
jgi:sodium transport system permease protein